MSSDSYPVFASPADLGEAIRREREALGFTQEHVAREVGTRRQTIGALESGRNVTTLVLFRTLAVLGRRLQLTSKRPTAEDASRLMFGDEDEPPADDADPEGRT